MIPGCYRGLMVLESRADRSLSIGRLVLFTVFSLAVTLVTLELVLRLGGLLWLGWATSGDTVPADDSALELWALGDSYTVGVGADHPATESYPAVAAQLLRERTGRQVLVRNLARPGLNSSQVLARLERALQETKAPDWVVLLAGINNVRWLGQSGHFCLASGAKVESEPEPEPEPVTDGRVAWLRSLRLYKLFSRALQEKVDSDRPALACEWVAEGFQHLDQGRVEMARACFALAEQLEPHSPWAMLGLGRVEARTGRPELAVNLLQKAREGGLVMPSLSLALRSARRAAGFPALEDDTRALEMNFPDFLKLVRAWERLEGGDPQGALEDFTALTDTSGERFKELRGTVRVFAEDGRGWALRRLGRLEASSGAFARANELGRDMFIVPHLQGWSHLGLALNAVDGIAAEDLDAGWPAEARSHLQLAARDRSATATVFAIQAWGVAASSGGCALAVKGFRDALQLVPTQPLAKEGLASCRTLERLPPLARIEGLLPLQTLQVLTLQNWIEASDTRLVEADLRKAVSLTRAAGAQLLVLGYPEPDAHRQLWAASVRVAREFDVPLMDASLPMQRALSAGVPWSQLRIPDGHPTTRGYRLMGQQLAEALERLSQRRPEAR